MQGMPMMLRLKSGNSTRVKMLVGCHFMTTFENKTSNQTIQTNGWNPMKKRNFNLAVMGAAISAAVSLGTMPASAVEARIEVGTLTCEVEGGSGFIVGSSKDMDCNFTGIDGFSEGYSGTVRKFGIDIG